jgi:hypothetical protein
MNSFLNILSKKTILKHFFFSTIFIVLTFYLGIVTHEIGHAIAAYFFDYKDIKITYKSTQMKSPFIDSIQQIKLVRAYEIQNNIPFPEQKFYVEKFKTPTIFIFLSANILTFLIGFGALLFIHLKFTPVDLQYDNPIIYISLFLCQFISDGLVLLGSTIQNIKIQLDLVVVAKLLTLNKYVLVCTMSIISSFLIYYFINYL